MLNQESVEQQEDDIRQAIQTLPDACRVEYYQRIKRKIKDPDTYAVLNFFLFIGLHNFYLGRWGRALCTLLSGLVGLLLLFDTSTLFLGILIIVAVLVMELRDLFRAQLIVQHHNNTIMSEMLKAVKKAHNLN